MAIIEETVANTTQTVELNEKNVEMVKCITDISNDLSNLSEKMSSL